MRFALKLDLIMGVKKRGGEYRVCVERLDWIELNWTEIVLN